MKTVFIKLTKTGPISGPFNIYTESDEVISLNVPKNTLIAGTAFMVEDDVIAIKIVSTGDCAYEKIVSIVSMVQQEYMNVEYSLVTTGCAWRHLTNIQLYNSFYGKTEPYVIEYPFTFKMQDEIIQNVKDYTKAYEYLPNTDGVFSYNNKIETDNQWFNKAIIYNGQQSSGLLNLIPKPLHNMQAYLSYPKFNVDSKDILFTKSDNFYQYNTFWSLNISSQVPLFVNSCESLSVDKVINDENMDYGIRSFKKSQIRAKEAKIRHILDNSCTTHLVSIFLLVPTQISFK